MNRFLPGCAAMLVAVACEVGCQSLSASPKAHRVPTLPTSARPANSAGMSAQEINQGAKLTIAKCARCHPLYDPSAYTDGEWRNWMAKMSKKAHLKAEQEDLLQRYLGAFRVAQGS